MSNFNYICQFLRKKLLQRLPTPEEDKWTRIASDDYNDAVYNNALLIEVYTRELDYMAHCVEEVALHLEAMSRASELMP